MNLDFIVYVYMQFWTPETLSSISFSFKQGRKRLLDTPKRMIERREREGEREKAR